jgi:hypothetical protein
VPDVLPIRDLWDTLGHDLEGLSDDDLLRASELLIERFGTTSPGHPARQRVLDEVRGVGPATNDPAPCCTGRVYAGPSGVVRRHTCARKGEPWVDDVATAERVAEVIELHARPAFRIHPACKAAWTDGATPCWRCLPLLCGSLECDHDACRYALAHADDEDDRRGNHA